MADTPMHRGFRRVMLATSFFALSACSTVGNAPQPSAAMGLLIARDRCATCHETGGYGESPNPRAPAFAAIVSRPAMTPEVLTSILADSHDYPIEMGFRLEPHQVDSLVAYMVRWRSARGVPQS